MQQQALPPPQPRVQDEASTGDMMDVVALKAYFFNNLKKATLPNKIENKTKNYKLEKLLPKWTDVFKNQINSQTIIDLNHCRGERPQSSAGCGEKMVKLKSLCVIMSLQRWLSLNGVWLKNSESD